LSGESPDLSFVQIDLNNIPALDRRVYELARTIPPGETLTYGQIATRLGDPLLARDVGQALARNPFPIVVPCHRVVAAGGKLGGFSARGGVATKQRLLAIERANISWQLPLYA
jgi:methylated-DNA-[protein]-cysteine S-methyltransferase